MKRLIASWATALALLTMPAVITPGISAAEEGMSPGMISSAKNADDHLKLAADYEKQATELRAEAKKHREMAEMYVKNPSYLNLKAGFDQHCRAIAKSFEAAAAEAEKLAKAHRQMAAKAK